MSENPYSAPKVCAKDSPESGAFGRSISLRAMGWIWIALAPLLLVMAALSTVESLTTYYMQLAAFSVAGFAALIFGVGTLAQATWAPRGLLVLAWLGCAYFFGSAVLGLAFWTINGMRGGFLAALIIVSVIAAPGALFYLMAKVLKSGIARASGAA